MRNNLFAILLLLLLPFLIIPNPLDATQNSILKSKFGSRSKLDLCYKNVTSSSNIQKCSTQRSCLDIRLPYRNTNVPDYVLDMQFSSMEQVTTYLQKWYQFRHLPKCWPDLQVTLCSIFVPQSEEDLTTGKILRTSRPSVESCIDLINNEHCKFIERHYGWDPIFNCSDTNLYAKNCTNELRDYRHKSNAPACHYPLVASNDNRSWFKDIGGCSMNCKYPILDVDDQAHIKVFIGILTRIGLFMTFMALLLEANNRREKIKRSLQVIRKCVGCQFLIYLGWYLQIFLARDIACSSSGAPLYGLPLIANACVLSFLLTYLPSLSFFIWYAFLGELINKELDNMVEEAKSTSLKPKDSHELENTKKNTVVDLLSYFLPVVLLVTVAFLGQIDGNGLYGICSIGQQSFTNKALFVILPDLIFTAYGNLYLLSAICKMSSAKEDNPILKSDYIRTVAIAIFSTLRTTLSIGNYVYVHKNRSLWDESVDNFVSCRLNPIRQSLNNDYDVDMSILTHPSQECELDTKPVVSLYYLELISTLGLGIIIASWSFTYENYYPLSRKIIHFLESKEDKKKRACWNLMEDGHYDQPTNDMQLDSLRNRSTTPTSLGEVSITSSASVVTSARKGGSRRGSRRQRELKPKMKVSSEQAEVLKMLFEPQRMISNMLAAQQPPNQNGFNTDRPQFHYFSAIGANPQVATE